MTFQVKGKMYFQHIECLLTSLKEWELTELLSAPMIILKLLIELELASIWC